MPVQRRTSKALVTAIVLAAASTPAFAGTSNLSGTVTTTVPTDFQDDSDKNAADATGASDAKFLEVESTADDVTGTWVVSAGLSITGFRTSSVPITIWMRSADADTITVSITQLRFSDGSVTASSGSISESLVISTRGTLTSWGFTTDLSTYTNYGALDLANVNSVIIDFTISTAGKKGQQFELDAVDFAGASPEPATIGLFALGAAGLACAALRRRRVARENPAT